MYHLAKYIFPQLRHTNKQVAKLAWKEAQKKYRWSVGSIFLFVYTVIFWVMLYLLGLIPASPMMQQYIFLLNLYLTAIASIMVSDLIFKTPLKNEIAHQLKGLQGWIEDDDPNEIPKEKPNPHTA